MQMYMFRWVFTILLFILTRYVEATELLQLEAKPCLVCLYFILCLMRVACESCLICEDSFVLHDVEPKNVMCLALPLKWLRPLESK